MSNETFERDLRAIAGDRVHRHAPLAPLTTFHVGGPADWLVEVRSAEECVAALALAASAEVPVTMIGGGSNVLIADKGIRGLVMKLRLTSIERVDDTTIRSGAGVMINGLVRWTIANALSGIEAWAGTPGTLGGAIYGNAHYGGRNIGEFVTGVRLCESVGTAVVRDVNAGDMEFGYDTSRLQRSGEILLSADLRVGPGDVDQLRATARASLAHRKRTQPLSQPSAGCIFQNPNPARDRVPDGIPASAGALIDRAGLKGRRAGGAAISSTHANFIVTDGLATARDIRALINAAHDAVLEQFGVDLREEIVCLGEW